MQLLKAGGADPDDEMLARAKYLSGSVELNEDSKFSCKTGKGGMRKNLYRWLWAYCDEYEAA